MSDFRVASRYARSVFDLAIELKLVDRIHNDMTLLEQVCKDNRALVTLLRNPIIRYDFKLRVLRKVFEKHVDTLTMKFFHLACRKNRASILPEAAQVFTSLYRDYKGIVRADVRTAITISASIKKDFESLVGKSTGKQVELNSIVDESLLGGYVLRVGDMQVDNSLKSKLNDLRRELKSRP